MPTDSNMSDVSDLNRRTFLKIAATSTTSFALAGVTSALAQEPELQQSMQAQLTHLRLLQSDDIVVIQQLNSLYFFPSMPSWSRMTLPPTPPSGQLPSPLWVHFPLCRTTGRF